MRVVSILLLTEVLCVLCVYYLPGTVSPIPYLPLNLSFHLQTCITGNAHRKQDGHQEPSLRV